jgi:hypothetical protein
MIVVFVALILPLAHASQSLATEEGVVHVAQPIDLPATECVIATMGYIEMLGSVMPGQGVHLVAAPNRMAVQGQMVQRNSASNLNIRTGTELSSEPTGLFGDTLRVFLDLSQMPRAKAAGAEAVIARTVDCVLITAWYGRVAFDPTRGRVEAKYVNLKVKGPRAYARYAGTYTCARIERKALESLH